MAKRFDMDEVSMDEAYLSEGNLATMAGYGAAPFVPFESNTTGRGSPLWESLYHQFMLSRDVFMSHYHRRSNVETSFSMVKAKFGDSVRAKTDVGQVNEVMLKILNHNLCCLISAIYELGIGPNFT